MVKKLLLLVLTIGSYVYAANVTASVNTTEVMKGNPVQFSIRATGGSAAFPNITQIAGVGVTDSGTSTSTSMSITINGMQKERATIRSYIFVPEHDMTIPAYTVRVGNETLKTKPIAIKVTESTAPSVQANNSYSFVMKSSKKRVTVGESFVMTLYLSLSDRLGVQQVSDYIEPSSADFFLKDLGKQKQYKQGNRSIIEKQYSVTAKKEGNFTIAPASAKVGITDRSRRDLFGRYGIRWMDVRSNALTLQVSAPKTETDLVGEFRITSHINTQKVKANKPVNLTVTLQGRGNLEDFTFPKYEIDGVTVYDDDAKVQSHSKNGELSSTYRKTFVFISDESFTIPKQVISAYNTKTNEVEILEVPSYTIEVEKKKGLSSYLPSNSTNSTKMIVKVPTFSEATSAKVVPHSATQVLEVIPKWMLLLAFLSGMLTLYLLQKLLPLWQKKEKPYKESEALKILYAHMSEDNEIEAMVRKLYAKQNGDKSVQIDKKVLREMVDRVRRV